MLRVGARTGNEGRVPAPASALAISQVTDVSRSSLDYGRLYGGNIELPLPERSNDTYNIDLVGWVVGRNAKAVLIELVHDETCLISVPVLRDRPDALRRFPDAPGSERSGFSTTFTTLRLPRRFTIEAVAVLDNGERARLATIQGERANLIASREPELQPLIVTSLGRSGSSFLTQLLASHPEIVAYQPFESEPRVATYWFGILLALASPRSYIEQLDPRGAVESDTWWLGEHSHMDRPLADRVDPVLANWLGSRHIEHMAAMCQEQIDRLYGRVGVLAGKKATCFVEKALPTNLTSLVLESYEQPREVILVRDFRDMVASLLAFAPSRGGHALGREGAASDEQFVRDVVHNSVLRLVRAMERRQDSYVIRYEDLVLDRDAALRSLLEGLELGADPGKLASTYEANEALRPHLAQLHRTSESAVASIGRWRRDLSPELQETCNEFLGFGLTAFGYEI